MWSVRTPAAKASGMDTPRGVSGLAPLDATLARLGLEAAAEVLAVPSGYPAPKFVNVTLLRSGGKTRVVETSSAEPAALAGLVELLAERGVQRVDEVVATHGHGDHAGAAHALANLGRSADVAAPIYLHSAGHRFLTAPALEFLDEAYAILAARANRGIDDFEAGQAEATFGKYLRAEYLNRYARTPRSGLRFVDHGDLPTRMIALHTPGHSDDCTFFLDLETGLGFPGDTMLARGHPEDPSSHGFMVPPLTVLQQRYSRAVEAYLRSLGRLRRFFETEPVRAVVPPHGRLAITEPLAFCDAAEAHFGWLHDQLVRAIDDRARPFTANELLEGLVPDHATPQALSGHAVGLLCLYAEFGYLDAEEHPRTRTLRFVRRRPPVPGFVASRIREDRSPLTVFRGEA